MGKEVCRTRTKTINPYKCKQEYPTNKQCGNASTRGQIVITGYRPGIKIRFYSGLRHKSQKITSYVQNQQTTWCGSFCWPKRNTTSTGGSFGHSNRVKLQNWKREVQSKLYGEDGTSASNIKSYKTCCYHHLLIERGRIIISYTQIIYKHQIVTYHHWDYTSPTSSVIPASGEQGSDSIVGTINQ
jgi:hypothetical protein